MKKSSKNHEKSFENQWKSRLTGSTIRNWDKVKTWLDQMFWQIYQKLMLSGFLSSGNLCLTNFLKLFWPHANLNSLHQKGCHILVKNWIFDDPFHKKLPVLVILVPVMIRPSGSGGFLRKLDFRGCLGQWAYRGHWGQWGWRGF